MSSLGIRFALPYTGTNGLKVTGNQIGLDPHAVGNIGALQIGDAIDTTVTWNGDKLSIYGQDLDGNQITILQNGGEVMNVGIQGNIYSATYITANNDIGSLTGNLYLFNDGGNQSQIHFNEGKANQVNMLVLPQTTGTVVPATTKYIPVTINGISYKLIIAN